MTTLKIETGAKNKISTFESAKWSLKTDNFDYNNEKDDNGDNDADCDYDDEISKNDLQAPCQVELENWVNSIHSACAAAFAR